MIFKSRISAGKELAKELEGIEGDLLVMGLARGGVVVAAPIAEKFNAPLSPIIIRKIRAPDNPELALGAVADAGVEVYNEDLISLLGVSKEYLKKEIELQKEEIAAKEALYFGKKKPVAPKGKTVILVDDGIATGASIKVAIASLKALEAKEIIVAVPVASKEALSEIEKLVERVICLFEPISFYAVGAFYREFPQVSDQEVVNLIRGS